MPRKTFPLVSLSHNDAFVLRTRLRSMAADPAAYAELAQWFGITAMTLLRAASGLPVPRASARLILAGLGYSGAGINDAIAAGGAS